MVLTKHASNDPRGDYPNPVDPKIAFNKKWFKSLEFERKWAPEFKERYIITRRDFVKNFPGKYTHLMLASMDALEWTIFRPLPKLAYTKLVRSFYCNLEVGTLDNIEYTIDSRVKGKNIVLNPMILSEITGIANAGECVFVSKSSHLDKYATMEKPLNLNYIILKEMVDVRNHNIRAQPFHALLTRIFLHFHVSLDSQPSQGLGKGFSMNTIKKGKNLGLTEDEREEEKIQMIKSKNKMWGMERSIAVHEEIHEGVHVEHAHVESPMHGAYPSQEGNSYQEGPSAWFFGYFNELKESLGEIKQRQEEIIQTQVRHEEFMARLGDTHHELRQQVNRLGDFYEEQGQRHLEALWVDLVPYPPPSPVDPSNVPSCPPYRAPPY
ncbi:hypothetical protein Acr_27g0002410 [Actinidia rufa]|uniref:Uncharacterized protein n=1 Tax=Actinidia rufa TaxID=165716 RepID=A0A7J0H5Z5_9ERIC|nr:hypothetical protein Acr_27g0002410 [Actinidia rufa]